MQGQDGGKGKDQLVEMLFMFRDAFHEFIAVKKCIVKRQKITKYIYIWLIVSCVGLNVPFQ